MDGLAYFKQCLDCPDYDRENEICGRWHFFVAINRITGNPQRLLLCIEEDYNNVKTTDAGRRAGKV